MNAYTRQKMHDAPPLSAHEQIAYERHRERVKDALAQCEAEWDSWMAKAAAWHYRRLLSEMDDFDANDAWYHMRMTLEVEHDDLPPTD